MKTSVFLLIMCFLLIPGPSLYAADWDYIEDEGGSMWESDSFVDPDSMDDVLDTSSKEYIGEEEAASIEAEIMAEENKGMGLAKALEKDKDLLGDNIMFGLGTGLTIGVWIALLQSKKGRDNARYIGTGAVIGTLLGTMVGTKSVYKAEASPDEDFRFSPDFKPSDAISFAQIELSF